MLRISKLEGEAGIRFLHTDICREHKAWSGHHAPTAVDIEDVLARTQNRTTFFTCTKRGAAIINDHTVQVLFRNRRQRLLAQVPGDYEDNQENYGEGGKLCTDRAPVPAQVPLYRGLRIVLTKNLDKEHHFVNGMGAVVEAVDLETASVLVRADTGFLLTVYKYTDTESCRSCGVLPVAAGLRRNGLQVPRRGARPRHLVAGSSGLPWSCVCSPVQGEIRLGLLAWGHRYRQRRCPGSIGASYLLARHGTSH